jgi:hypothetical protein
MATHALTNGFENPQNDDGSMMIGCTSAVLQGARASCHRSHRRRPIGEMMTINAKAFGVHRNAQILAFMVIDGSYLLFLRWLKLRPFDSPVSGQ